MFKAILFDLDNTLFDRNATAANYYGLLYDLYGKNAPVTRDEAVRLTMIADADGYGDRPFLYSRMQHDWGYGIGRTICTVISSDLTACAKDFLRSKKKAIKSGLSLTDFPRCRGKSSV